jgi:NAD(P)-dependent dehydrogenase (short-subunit alcohol dehydrogenase family)
LTDTGGNLDTHSEAAMTMLSDLSGKTCIVTGASSGIGKVTAGALADMGARVVMVCRDAQRGEAARAEITQRSGSESIDLLIADLSSQRQVRRLASDVAARGDRLDVLVNNAGAMNTSRTVTRTASRRRGPSITWRTSCHQRVARHALKANGAARIVSVSSRRARRLAHRLRRAQASGASAATRSTASRSSPTSLHHELARRLDGSGVTANCMHPGVVATGFGHNNRTDLLGRTFSVALKALRPFILSPERGAETSIYLAASPEVEGVSGKYFASKKALPSAPATYDGPAALRLWQLSEQMTQPSAATHGAVS